MRSRGLCVLCTLLIGAGFALADENPQKAPAGDIAIAQPGVMRTTNTETSNPTEAYVEEGGTWVSGDRLRDANRPGGRDCPEPYLAGQDEESNTWLYTDLAFCYQGNCQRVTCEDFPPPNESLLTKPVGIISFFGTYIDDADSGCSKDHSFRVCFYVDNNGEPVLPAQNCINGVVPTFVTDEGDISFGGELTADKLRFTLVLPTPVNVHQAPYNGKGHFSIAHDGGETGCWFLIGPSFPPEGNRRVWRWYESNIAGTKRTYLYDVMYCFAENKQGACCDDCDPGSCDSNSNEFYCNQIGGRFLEGGTCAGFVPPCGQASGACCKDDGTCELLTCAECEMIPEAYWAGAGTDCNDCCVIVCVNNENEPRCEDDYDDNYNGGCNAETPVFSTISCDTTICGESGTFVLSGPGAQCAGDANCDGQVTFGDINPFVDGMLCVSAPDPVACYAALYPGCNYLNCDTNGDDLVTFGDINPFVSILTQQSLPVICPTGSSTPARDMDWYQYTSTEPFEFTFSVNAEFEPVIWVTGSCTGCDDEFTLINDSGNACEEVSITSECVPAGTYWFIVAPATFEGVPCGRDYKVWLTCTECEPCLYTCDPNEPGYQVESEPCGSDSNGGCGDPNDPNDPDQFEDVTFVEVPVGSGKYYAAVCATSYARYFPDEELFRRDIDFYRVPMAGQASVNFSVETEIPLHMTPLFANTAGDPYFCGGDMYGYWTAFGWWDPCNEKTPITDTFKAGDNFVFVAPEDAATEPIFDGYPCCRDINSYVLRMDYGEPNCPTNIDCNDNVDIKENEPPCFDGYLDSFNGGCDVNPPAAVKALPGGFGIWAICGVSATFHQTIDPNSPLVVDADWYSFELEDPSWLCIEGLSELPIDVDIWGPLATLDCATILDPNGDPNLQIFNGYYAACADYDQDPIGGANWDPDPNDPNNENRPQMPAGNYWMRIAVQEGWEDITCNLGWEYLVNLTDDRSCPDTTGK